jgi:hypothetical protein
VKKPGTCTVRRFFSPFAVVSFTGIDPCQLHPVPASQRKNSSTRLSQFSDWTNGSWDNRLQAENDQYRGVAAFDHHPHYGMT